MMSEYDFEAFPEHRSLPEEFSDICVSEEARHIMVKRMAALADAERETESHDPVQLLQAGMWKFYTPVFYGEAQ